MITMEKKHQILMMHVHEGVSFREIARRTGVHRETVSKYVKQYEQKRQQLLSEGKDIDIQALAESLVEKPRYKVGVRPKRKLTAEIEQKIRDHLHENEAKKRKGQHKQQKKAMDIYEALIAEDVDISYSTVRSTVRSLEQKPREAFVKETYHPGDVCEFDWGEVRITIGGKLQSMQMAVFTSAYGNYRWACVFPKQTTDCFQEAHARFFEDIGGVFQTMVYDNMKVAVKRFAGTEKEPTDSLRKLSTYYHFKFRFCNVRRGNEKGHVEKSVDVVRRKAFAFKDQFEDLEEVNAYLSGKCQHLNDKPQSNGEEAAFLKMEQERKNLLPAPPKWDASQSVRARVDKYATVRVDQNRYSVPDHLVGHMVDIRVYAERIRCFYQEKGIADHKRLMGRNDWCLELDHILETLKKKPGALAGSLALKQADQKVKSIYTTYYTGKAQQFLELIDFIKEGTSFTNIERSISELHEIHPRHVTTDKIKILCAKYEEAPFLEETTSEEAETIAFHARKHLKDYAHLFQMTDNTEGERVS